MKQEYNVQRAAAAVRQHLSLADRRLIAEVGTGEDAERLLLLLNTKAGEVMSERDFAAFVLACAKRVRAGGVA